MSRKNGRPSLDKGKVVSHPQNPGKIDLEARERYFQFVDSLENLFLPNPSRDPDLLLKVLGPSSYRHVAGIFGLPRDYSGATEEEEVLLEDAASRSGVTWDMHGRRVRSVTALDTLSEDPAPAEEESDHRHDKEKEEKEEEEKDEDEDEDEEEAPTESPKRYFGSALWWERNKEIVWKGVEEMKATNLRIETRKRDEKRRRKVDEEKKKKKVDEEDVDPTEAIAEEFCDWAKDRGLGSQKFDKGTITALFADGTNSQAMRSVSQDIQELPFIPKQLSELYGEPEKSEWWGLHRHVMHDVYATSKVKPKVAFGKHNPEYRAPPKRDPRRWLDNSFVPAEVLSGETLWKPLLGTPVLKRYCIWLSKRPHYGKPDYLVRAGCFKPENLVPEKYVINRSSTQNSKVRTWKNELRPRRKFPNIPRHEDIPLFLELFPRYREWFKTTVYNYKQIVRRGDNFPPIYVDSD